MTLMTAMPSGTADPHRLEIDSLRPGQRVEGLLYLEHAASDNASNGKWYQRFSFRDLRSSTIDGKRWDCADDPPNAGVYRVTATVDEYKGVRQLKILRPIEPTPEVDPTPYLVPIAPARAGAARLGEQLLEAIAEIRDRFLAPLLVNVLDEETLGRLLEAPAAVRHHGCFPGGLAYHTLEVRRIALSLAMSGGGASCNLDLLAAGALLHDVGKIDEIEYSPDQGHVVYRKDPPIGQLYGHMVCGVLRIHKEALDLGLQDTPIVQQLIHLLVSHHGKLEWGAPVVPLTTEARLLHAADQAAADVEVTLDVLDQVNTRIDGEWLDGGHGRPRLYRGFVTC